MDASPVKTILLRTAGTNCDRELALAFEMAGSHVDTVHINELMANPGRLADYQILALPGGFSYGDDIASGRILANQIVHHLGEALQQWIADGKMMLGICNGFQTLVKAGLLPGPMPQLSPDDAFPATLTDNANGRFMDCWIRLLSTSAHCPWMKPGKFLDLPIAHGEGRFVVRDNSVLEALRANDQVAFRYVDAAGNVAVASPENPNGSVDGIAGVCDVTGRVLGLMPHPERFISSHLHPTWTRQQSPPAPAGLELFQNAVDFIRQNSAVTVYDTAGSR